MTYIFYHITTPHRKGKLKTYAILGLVRAPQKYEFLWVMPPEPRSSFFLVIASGRVTIQLIVPLCHPVACSGPAKIRIFVGDAPRTQVIFHFYNNVCFALHIHLGSGVKPQNDKSFYVLFLRTPFLITSLSLRAIAWQSSLSSFVTPA